MIVEFQFRIPLELCFQSIFDKVYFVSLVQFDSFFCAYLSILISF